MATFISRTLGVFVLVGLAAYGAMNLAGDVLLWQEAYMRNRRPQLPRN